MQLIRVELDEQAKLEIEEVEDKFNVETVIRSGSEPYVKSVDDDLAAEGMALLYILTILDNALYRGAFRRS